MMQLAINWSPEAHELVETGKIEVDLYKCPDWLRVVDKAQAQRSSYVHFPLSIGIGQHTEWNFAEIQHWLDTTSTQFVNCHIVPKRDIFEETITLDDLIAQLSDEVQQLVNQFGAERVIIENCPLLERHEQKGYLTHSREPRLFHEIINNTGCGFLLDVSHAYLTSTYWQRDFLAYVNELPVQHLREMHVTGIGIRSDGLISDHMPMTAPDWLRLEDCITQIKSGQWQTPAIMAFEYGGIEYIKESCGSDKNRIEEQVPRLYELAQSICPETV